MCGTASRTGSVSDLDLLPALTANRPLSNLETMYSRHFGLHWSALSDQLSQQLVKGGCGQWVCILVLLPWTMLDVVIVLYLKPPDLQVPRSFEGISTHCGHPAACINCKFMQSVLMGLLYMVIEEIFDSINHGQQSHCSQWAHT